MYLKKVNILIIILMMLLAIGINIKPVQAVSTTLSASSKTVNSGENFSITISSSIKLTGWTISLTDSSSCTFNSASGGEVSGKSIFGTNVNGTTTLATYNFKAPKVEKDTKYTIRFSGTNMCDVDTNEVQGASCTATITVKGSGSGNNNSSSGNNTSNNSSTNNNGTTSTTTKPNFTNVNRTVYTTGEVNLRDSWSTSSKATSVPKGTELKLTATSTKTVNQYVWYRVEYKGATKYIASGLVTDKKPEENQKSDNNNLSSIAIDGVTLSPEFKKDVLEYTAKVDKEVTSLTIDAKTENNKAKIEIEGNEELKEGENKVIIKVTAEDGTAKNYTITVTKATDVPNEIVDNNALKLSELKITGVDFGEGFDPDLYYYKLSLNMVVENLKITAKANQQDATVEILGNSDFKEGENVVTIILTSGDGLQTATYQIEVVVPGGNAPKQDNIQFYLICGGVAVAVVIVIIAGVLVHKRREEDEEWEEEIEEYHKENDLAQELEEYGEKTPRNELKNKEEEKEKEEIQKEELVSTIKERRKVTLDEFLDTSEIDIEKPKHSKGKHSI